MPILILMLSIVAGCLIGAAISEPGRQRTPTRVEGCRGNCGEPWCRVTTECGR